MHPVGERGEAGHAAVEQHDLAVEQDVGGEPGQARELGEQRRHVAAAAVGQVQPAPGHVGQQPHAVPLDLEEIVGPRR